VAARKQKDTNRREPRARYPSKACPQWPISSNQALHPKSSPPPNNCIKLWLYQWINPLMKSEPSWSNHFQKKVTSAGNQDFNTWTFRGHFRFKL
jgi:hypothetical protein